MQAPTDSERDDRYPDRRIYANTVLRLDVRAALPCFHDWIGWYLDMSTEDLDGNDVSEPPNCFAATLRIDAEPPPDAGRAQSPVPDARHRAQSTIDVARRTIHSWPSAPAGRRVPMDQGQHFFVEPLLTLLDALDRHPIHCSYVRKGLRRVMLIGDTRAGKSSLAALLTRFGWQLHADDLSFFAADEAGVELLPLPRRIKYRSASIDAVLQQHGITELSPTDPGERDRRTDPLTLVFPRFCADGPTANFALLPPARATQRLLDGNLHAREGRLGQFEALCRLGAHHQALDLTYRDADPMALGAALDERLSR